MQVLPQKSVHPPAFAGLTPTERHRLEQRIRAAQLGHSAWITFPGLGDHGASIVFRLLLLWILAVPLLLLRSVLAIALLWATMGFFQLATSTATVGGGVLSGVTLYGQWGDPLIALAGTSTVGGGSGR